MDLKRGDKMKIEDYLGYKIVWADFNKPTIYDGSQFSSHYLAEKLKIIGDSVYIFRGPMKLSKTEMVDLKDIIRESHLAKILISSDDALNIIIEEFDVQPPNIEIAYYRLRLLVFIVIEELNNYNVEIKREGTDIYIHDRKLNVGIASIGKTNCKIHLGININNSGTPNHVQTTSLLNIGMKEDNLMKFILKIVKKYIEEIYNIKQDIRKTRPI